MTAKPQQDDDGFDAEAFDALDSYCQALHAGQASDRSSLVARDPGLAGVFDCLEELHRLSAAAGLGPAPPTLPLAPAGPDSSPAPLLSPAEFGNYELLGLLGRGGMGAVYKARQKELDRIVALKMILGCQFASPAELRRFQAEARATAKLTHPHVLQVYEAGCVNGQHFFTMQYVDGPSLAQRLRDGPLEPEEAARCLLGVARAVAYLHEQGIVHRDLKPSNILLQSGVRGQGPGVSKEAFGSLTPDSCPLTPDSSLFPYVTDFGLIKMVQSSSDLTGTGVIVGTPSYMAPEQAAGRNAAVGPLSDVYSIGAILYETLTGRPPFHESTPFDTLVQVIENEPALPHELKPNVPRELELICLKALGKKPELRYASASALADDLERFLRGEPVSARPQNLVQRLVRWARQEPGLVARLTALGASAAIAAIYYQLNHQVPLWYHLTIMGLLALWALASFCCQWLLRAGRHARTVGLAWLMSDGVMLTAVLIVDQAFYSPLAIGYGILIVGSGFWYRASVVWFTTALACFGYASLTLAGIVATGQGVSPHHHLIIFAGLGVTGWMVATQVERVRVLSRFYERK